MSVLDYSVQINNGLAETSTNGVIHGKDSPRYIKPGDLIPE